MVINFVQYRLSSKDKADKVQAELSTGYKSLVDVREKELNISKNEGLELQTKLRDITAERDALRTEYMALVGVAVKDIVNFAQLKREKDVLEEELMKVMRNRLGEGTNAKQ